MLHPPLFIHDDLPGFHQGRLPPVSESFGMTLLATSHDSEHIRQQSNAIHHQQETNGHDDGQSIDQNQPVACGPIMKMTQSAYNDILDDLVERPFRNEKAGMLLGPLAEDDFVTHYVPDHNGLATPASFTLDSKGLNKTLRKRKAAGLTCKGVVHAHPPNVLHPSFGDLRYVAKLFANPRNCDAAQVMLPIVCNGRLYPYLIDADNPREVLVARLILV